MSHRGGTLSGGWDASCAQPTTFCSHPSRGGHLVGRVGRQLRTTHNVLFPPIAGGHLVGRVGCELSQEMHQRGAGRESGPGDDPTPLGWAWSVSLPGLPRIRTCGTTASGSSHYGFATLSLRTGRRIRADRSGYRCSKHFIFDQFMRDRQERRSSHLRHRRTVQCRKCPIAFEFPVIP